GRTRHAERHGDGFGASDSGDDLPTDQVDDAFSFRLWYHSVTVCNSQHKGNEKSLSSYRKQGKRWKNRNPAHGKFSGANTSRANRGSPCGTSASNCPAAP